MSLPGFGRLTPIQADMLRLAGVNVDCLRYGFDPANPGAELIPEQDRLAIMKEGHARLMEHTGQDFGFDLVAWQDWLICNPDFGYTHPYGSAVTEKFVRDAIADPDRQRLLRMAANG
jgi:hypothetical protein